MINKIRKFVRSIIIVCMMSVLLPSYMLTAYADEARIAFSDPSVMVGSEVSVTMKVTSTTENILGSVNIMLSYDSNMLEFISGNNAEGGAGSIRVTETGETGVTEYVYSLRFKALEAGTAKITVNTQEIYNADSQTVTLSKQGDSTITISPLATTSTDASLSALKISPGTLTPAFSSDVENYTATVAGDTVKVAVSAGTSHASAKVVISGNTDLVPGENVITCKVTAEDGQTVRNYIITVTKEEGTTSPATEGNGDLNVAYDDAAYTVNESFDAATLPEGFEAESYIYNGAEVMAGKSADKALILLSLSDINGAQSFFIYNEMDHSLSPYAQILVSSRAVIVLSPDSEVAIPEEFKETAISLDGIKVRGWVLESDTEQQYCMVYGMNWNGEKNFYRYDIKEKTIQRYFSNPAADAQAGEEGDYLTLAEKYNGLVKDYNMSRNIIIGMAVLIAALIAALLFLFTKRKNSDSDAEEYYEEESSEENISPAKKLSREEMYMLGEETEEEEIVREDVIEEESVQEEPEEEFEEESEEEPEEDGETEDEEAEDAELTVEDLDDEPVDKKAADNNDSEDSDDGLDFFDL